MNSDHTILQSHLPVVRGRPRPGAGNSPIDELCINTIRTLATDAVQAANSWHPGTPMAMAPVTYCLWQQFLRFDPQDPIWPSPDRFVLSSGHVSMLLYSLLHLTRAARRLFGVQRLPGGPRR
jgi:transketolase